jgi:hypothetical protein
MFSGKFGRRCRFPLHDESKTKVRVAGLPDGLTFHDLRQMFQPYGNPFRATVHGTMGYVHFKTTEEANLAVRVMHGQNGLSCVLCEGEESRPTRASTKGGPSDKRRKTEETTTRDLSTVPPLSFEQFMWMVKHQPHLLPPPPPGLRPPAAYCPTSPRSPPPPQVPEDRNPTSPVEERNPTSPPPPELTAENLSKISIAFQNLTRQDSQKAGL